MAAVILQKDFVGFYVICVYRNEAVEKKLSPALLELLKGKTCFHVKKPDDRLRKDIGEKIYRERGWA
jgi:hypothetical protein